MARIMAIDFGGKRTGIAVTDPLRISAQPLTTVPSHELLDFIDDYLSKEEVDLLVVGIPYSIKGGLSPIAKRIEQFMDEMSKRHPSIQLAGQDESYSSREASQAMIAGGMSKKKRQQKATLDKVSAAIILQRYMEESL